MEPESRPFLQTPAFEEKWNNTPRPSRLRSNLYNWRFSLLHGTAFLVYSSIFMILAIHRTNSHDSQAVWSPATNALGWEARTLDGLLHGNQFTGPPRPEVDAAWTNLTHGMNIKIAASEMDRLQYSSLALQDGSGYLGTLGVYHQLHCVKRLRRWLYKDHYYEGMNQDEMQERFAHTEHCLEMLRQSIMCHGDIGVIPFEWLHDPEGHTYEPTSQKGALHSCINWDKLDGWARARRVDIFETNLLVPPAK